MSSKKGEGTSPSPSDPLLTPKEVATILRLDVRSVYLLTRAGQLRHVRITNTKNGQIRIRRSWVDQWIDQRSKGGSR